MAGPVEQESAEYWAGRVRSIRRYTDGDRRAPYKPLLLLWLIGRHAEELPDRVSFREAEEELKQLMAPHRMGVAGVRVEFPFVYLGSDTELWRVEDTEGNNVADMPQRVKTSRPFLLREAEGALAPGFEQALRDPQVRSRVVNALLEMAFPETLHEELLEMVGLSNVVRLVLPLKNPDFRRAVLSAYKDRCSFCGFHGTLRGRPLAVDAAHVKMPSYGGPDDISNGIALCVFHRRLFSRGALGLDEDRRILVSRHMTTRGDEAHLPVMELVGEPMRGPQSGYDPPALRYVDWHYRNLFVKPPRPRPRLSQVDPDVRRSPMPTSTS